MYVNLYLYNTNSVCVCVCMCVCVCVRVCLSSIGGQTAGPIMTIGTNMRIKIGPTYGPERWAHWSHPSKQVLTGRAASTASSGCEP